MSEPNIRKLSEKEFPPPLLEIPEPPEELYLEGKLPNLAENIYLTVVGSRRFSHYGRDVCEKLINELAGYPIVIVSGLALGIDAIAHKSALAAGLKTVSLPGSGLGRHVLHPHSNRRLAEQILEAGGGLLSEFPPDYPAGLHTFPRRNRLMAGIAKAVLVIEAGERSGTLITARLATDYNRDVLAVPGSILSSTSSGTNRLIKQGATPITSGVDLLEALGFEVEPDDQLKLDLDSLSSEEKQVVETLTTSARPKDELIIILGLPTQTVNTLLATMEIKGLIKEELGEIRLDRKL